jgi:hypothetical protein
LLTTNTTQLTDYQRQVRDNPALLAGKAVVQSIPGWDGALTPELTYQVDQHMHPVVIDYNPIYRGKKMNLTATIVADGYFLDVYSERLGKITRLMLVPKPGKAKPQWGNEEGIKRALPPLLTDLKLKGMVGLKTRIDPWLFFNDGMTDVQGLEALSLVRVPKTVGAEAFGRFIHAYQQIINEPQLIREANLGTGFIRRAAIMFQVDISSVHDPFGTAHDKLTALKNVMAVLKTRGTPSLGLSGVIAFSGEQMTFNGITRQEIINLLRTDKESSITLELSVPAGIHRDVFARNITELLEINKIVNNRLGVRLIFDGSDEMEPALGALSAAMNAAGVAPETTILVDTKEGDRENFKQLRDMVRQKYGITGLTPVGIGSEGVEVEIDGSSAVDELRTVLRAPNISLVIAKLTRDVPLIGQVAEKDGTINGEDLYALLSVIAAALDVRRPLTRQNSSIEGAQIAAVTLRNIGHIEDPTRLISSLIAVVKDDKEKDPIALKSATGGMGLDEKQQAILLSDIDNIQAQIDKESSVEDRDIRSEMFAGYINGLIGQKLAAFAQDELNLDPQALEQSRERYRLEKFLARFVLDGPVESLQEKMDLIRKIKEGVGVIRIDNKLLITQDTQDLVEEYNTLQSKKTGSAKEDMGIMRNKVIGHMNRADVPPQTMTLFMHMYLALLKTEFTMTDTQSAGKALTPAMQAVKQMLSAA